MNVKNHLLLSFLCIILIGCKYSTEPLDSNRLAEYKNQYQMMYIYNNAIYSIRSDGTKFKKIIQFDNHIQSLKVNNNNTKIVFVGALDDYPMKLYIMNIDGSDRRRISPDFGDYSVCGPKFLSVEQKIIYEAAGKLYSVNYDGSENLQITPDSILVAYCRYSISGNRIVFSGELVVGDSTIYNGLYLLNTDGSNLVHVSANIEYSSPMLSPDANKISFRAQENGSEIYVMNIDGSNIINISNHPSHDWDQNWSPSGEQIYFESYRDGESHLYIVDCDGTDLRRITNYPAKRYFFPICSPDFTRIAYVDDTGDDYISDTIFILDIKTGRRMKLTEGYFTPIWLHNLE